MSQNNENSSTINILPAQGAIGWYEQVLKILDARRIPKIDESFLSSQNPKIASGDERKFIAGLKFLGLIDKDGNSTPLMEGLSLKGDKRKEILEKVVKAAYSKLFEELRIDLSSIGADDLTNTFLADYKMGSPRGANQASVIFASLAQKAGIPLSESISKMISPNEPRKARQGNDKPKKDQTKLVGKKKETSDEETIPENALARFTYKGVGVVDITDKDTFELAKGFFNLLAKKLEIPEE